LTIQQDQLSSPGSRVVRQASDSRWRACPDPAEGTYASRHRLIRCRQRWDREGHGFSRAAKRNKMNPASAAEGSVQVHSVFLCVLCVSEFFSLTPEKLRYWSNFVLVSLQNNKARPERRAFTEWRNGRL